MAKLKAIVDNLDSVPEAMRELYTQRDGKFVLDLDGEPAGYVAKGKLDEFRNNNVELMKQLEAMKGKTLSDEELAEFQRIRDEQQKNKDKELIDKGDIEKLIEQRTERMRADYEKQIEVLTANLDELQESYIDVNDRFAGTLITSEISKHIGTVGALRKGAMDDVIARAQRNWTYEEGNIVAKDADGTTIFGKDGKGPMTMAEWCSGLVEAAPYLFESSVGGDAKGGGQSQQSGLRVIPKGDSGAFTANLEGIAKGMVQVK